MTTISYGELLPIGMIIVLSILSVFRVFSQRELARQARRFEIFKARDRFIRLRLEGRIDEPFFDQLMLFCNRALLVTEYIDLRHFLASFNAASRQASKAFGQACAEQAKKDKEFADAMGRLLGCVLARSARNTILRAPVIVAHLIDLYLKGRVSAARHTAKIAFKGMGTMRTLRREVRSGLAVA